MTIGSIALGCCMLLAQTATPRAGGGADQVCQLVSANPPDFRPFAFVPTKIKDKNFKNRYPKISFVVEEDGKVREVKIVKSTGSPAVDSAIVRSVQQWRYKPQPGCLITMSSVVTIDIR